MYSAGSILTMPNTTQRIISALEKAGVLTPAYVGTWQTFATKNQGNILDYCLSQNLTLDRPIDRYLREVHKMPVVNLSTVQVDPTVVRRLPRAVCYEHHVAVFHIEGTNAYVAMMNPDQSELITSLQAMLGLTVVPFLADRHSIATTLDKAFAASVDDIRAHLGQLIDQVVRIGTEPEVMAKELPVIQLLEQLLFFASYSRASDLHLEPTEKELVVRMRVDGLLHEMFRWPLQLHAPLIARIKILGRMRIDEHLRPQDARFTFERDQVRMAVRVSMVPALYGQKCVLRLLPTDAVQQMSIDQLGLSVEAAQKLAAGLRHAHGLILVTGPTGAGKTTTLYTLLNALRERAVNISTIEDPVEYHIPGVTQIHVNADVGLSFANGLRSILRQDPDVIMVGEIRDQETAAIAVNAALTGHLVLSSLHTNSAAAAITRLQDLGIEPYLIASTLRLVVNQRLVRRVCPDCQRQERIPQLPGGVAQPHDAQPVTIVRGQGCPSCHRTGYQGRTGLFELLSVNENIQQRIQERAAAADIERQAVADGMTTLRQHGHDQVVAFTTTPEEVLRVFA